MTWPLVHGGGYCSSYKAFEGSSGLWAHLSGEGEAKLLCAADKDCTGIVQSTFAAGYFFTCAGGWDGSSINSWSAVRTFAKPVAGDAVPGDRLAHPALITATSAAAAALTAPTASAYSPGADPTVGWLGPFLVVMLTYAGHVSYKSEAAIRKEFFGDANSDTGYADMIDEASWGQYKLQSSDVDFITIDTGTTDPIDFSLGSTSNLVRDHQTYKDKIRPPPMSLAPSLGTAAAAHRIGKRNWPPLELGTHRSADPLIPCSPLALSGLPTSWATTKDWISEPHPSSPRDEHACAWPPFEAPLPC
eukprot:scaffold483_cov63-Phaeocystis_antarctica.AAC.2